MENTIERFYQDLLMLKDGWSVESVEQNKDTDEVTVRAAYDSPFGTYKCPVCGQPVALHDLREKTVRHLDTCDMETYIVVKYPRIKCPMCKVQAIVPPFAADNSRYTKVFEKRIIELCANNTIKKVAKDMGLTWHVVEGIKDRAVKRGKERQNQRPGRTVRHLAIDEVSFGKYHDYMTIVSDVDHKTVLAVLDGRTAEALITWFATQLVADFSQLQSISMDMAPPFIKAVFDSFPNAYQLLCFDRFHVAQLFGRTMDIIRRRESAAFPKGQNPLVKTRFEWFRNSGKTDNRSSRRRKFLALTRMPLETAKAWKIKELAATLWDYVQGGRALKAWESLLWRLSHSRIAELQRLGMTIKEHLYGILNAIRLRASNGIAEARNSCIQRAKNMACGFRDKARFGQEILFQWGGLNMAF